MEEDKSAIVLTENTTFDTFEEETATHQILEDTDISSVPEVTSMVLRTEHLYKKYGKRTVVNNVSIHVKQGEIVGLLGPNGAGKTTTFYMATGLVTPNSGKIYLNEEDITKFPVFRRARKASDTWLKRHLFSEK